MSRILLSVLLLNLLLLSLVLVSPAQAGDPAARRAELDEQREHYELMLRDAKTETAAQYFVDRLAEIAARRAALHEAPAAKPQPPARDILQKMNAWVRARIEERVSTKGVGLSDVVAWTRRELPDAFWSELESGVGARAIPPRAYAEQLWAGRPKGAWLTASYGSGTFIVTPPRRRPPRKDRPAKLPDDLKDQLPTPPTRDHWWTQASRAERTQLALAFFVEHSGLFEVGEKIWKTCPACAGKGFVKRSIQRHDTHHLCPRCVGVGQDATVRYR